MAHCMKKVENYCPKVCTYPIYEPLIYAINFFLRPYIDLLKNGTVVDGSLVWNQGMHRPTVIHDV